MRTMGWIISISAAALLSTPAATAEEAAPRRPLFSLNRGSSDDRVDLQALTRRAQAGNAHAQYALAMIYEEGRGGIKQDLATALSWYEEAARNGLKIAVEKLRAITDNE